MEQAQTNVDPKELEKFAALASRWWDPGSEFKPLHDINPLRLNYILEYTRGLQDKEVLDVGCGGGILAESMVHQGARVTGIDLGEAALTVAKLHMFESGAENLTYLSSSAEDLAKERAGCFDVITCMEMLEHVPDPAAVIQACADLAKPGGKIFFSTLNRNPKSYLFAIIGAEYLLRLLPKGTHDYARFIRPSELARWCREADLEVHDITGMSYNPLSKEYSLSRDVDVNVNYLVYACKPEA